MKSVALSQVNRYVLQKQNLLTGSQLNDIVQVVDDICGLHATGVKEPYLALLARTRNFSPEQLTCELCDTRRLINMRCVRGTLYLLTRELTQIAAAATKSIVIDLSERFSDFRGASRDTREKISRAVLQVIQDREMSLPEIKKALGNPPALSAILNLMCDQALLAARVQHGWQSRNYSYAAFSAYYPGLDLDKYNETTALELLILRYLRSFGPACLDDIAWWTGVLKSKTKEAFDAVREQLAEVSIEGLPGVFFLLASEMDRLVNVGKLAEPSVNILPILDPYLMGYRHRQRYLDPSRYDFIFDRTGNATSTSWSKVEWRASGTTEKCHPA